MEESSEEAKKEISPTAAGVTDLADAAATAPPPIVASVAEAEPPETELLAGPARRGRTSGWKDDDLGAAGKVAAGNQAMPAKPSPASPVRAARALKPESVGAKPWAPVAYVLDWGADPENDPSDFLEGLEAMEVRVLRSEEKTVLRYELMVPSARVERLEAYLRGFGNLKVSAAALSGKKAGSPLVLTVQIKCAAIDR
jgi:hypothetical protein